MTGTFQFKVKDANEIYTAREEENRFTIYAADSIKLFSLPSEEVARYIGEGAWVIVDNKKTYEEIGQSIGQLVDKKNKQYGDSFNKSGDILNVLYPNGVQPEQYRDLLAVTRIIDKLMRVANGNQGEENAWNDIGGYSILMSGGNENE
jgi:hypothetical protein